MRPNFLAVLGSLPFFTAAEAHYRDGSDITKSCQSLPELVKAQVPQAHGVTASFVQAKALNLSGTFNSVPFCRVAGGIPYPENNSVLFEVWLPEEESYNGRYLSIGKLRPEKQPLTTKLTVGRKRRFCRYDRHRGAARKPEQGLRCRRRR